MVLERLGQIGAVSHIVSSVPGGICPLGDQQSGSHPIHGPESNSWGTELRHKWLFFYCILLC